MVAPASRTGPPSLTAWVYDSPVGADAGEARLRRLRQRGAVTVYEAATISWAPGAHRPRFRQLRPGPRSSDSILGALCRRMWAPDHASETGGAPVAPGTDGLDPHLVDAGIEPAFLHQIRTAVASGTSALLVLALAADLDAIRAIIERGRARGDVVLLHTWLSPDAATELDLARRKLGDGDEGSFT